MKKSFLLGVLFFCSLGTFLTSCVEKEPVTHTMKVQVNYPPEFSSISLAGIPVLLTGNGVEYQAVTDESGVCDFTVSNGIYELSASQTLSEEGYEYIFNGILANIVVSENWGEGKTLSLQLVASVKGQIIIKELYNGGCPKDDGSGQYQYDQYVILYNNSSTPATLDNLCLGMADPYNANAGTNNYVDGVLSYLDLGYIPAINGIWYTQSSLKLDPGKQITIALKGAIDHTVSYSQSVDLSNVDYCTYDIDDYNNTNYYPAPSSSIPTSNYMLAYKYGAGNAWPLSNASPAFYIFTTKSVSPEAFASVEDYHYTAGKTNSAAFCCAKVPKEWILDAIEVFSAENVDNSLKRLTSDIDNGYVLLTNKLGHTLYRNVDKKATEAIAENEGKLVYGYAGGVEDSTDPSGIDAEASLKNGARIVYQDTNNSTNDFHERSVASLRQ